MSYLLNTLKSNPIGYWTFSGTLNDYNTLYTKNNATGTNILYTAPPLVANGGSAMKVISTSSVVISNANKNYQALSNFHTDKPFQISFWFNFNNQLNGSGSGIGVFKNDTLNIFTAKSSASTLARIYYDYNSNTFNFAISGSAGTNTRSYTTVRDFDKSYYISAIYDGNGAIVLELDGSIEDSIYGSINDYSALNATSQSDINFVIDGTSLSSTSGAGSATSFLIGELDFCNYVLNDGVIKDRMKIAGDDSNPISIGQQSGSTSYFSIDDSFSSQGYHMEFNGNMFNTGEINNLRVDNNGLSPIAIDPAIFVTNYYPNDYTINSSSGINWSRSDEYVSFDNFGKYCSNSFSLTAQVTRPNVTSINEYLFNIYPINGTKQLYLEYSANSTRTTYSLKYLDLIDSSSATLLTASSTGSAAVSNVGLSIDKSSNITLYSTETGSVTLYGSATTFSYVGSLNTSLSIGNSSYDQKSLISSIRNVGITDNTLSLTDSNTYTNVDKFMIRFTASENPFLISQYGYWLYVIPSSTLNNSLVYGTQIDWNGFDNCRVSIRSDSASPFTTVYRHSPMYMYDTTNTSKNIVLKVEIPTEYQVENRSQSFNNLNFSLYTNPSLFSDSLYQISPVPGVQNYTIRKDNNSLLKRSENLGIKFSKNSISDGGSASIDIPSSANYSAIEFWYRPDSIDAYRTNLMTNPSFESGTTGWNANQGSSIALNTSSALFGSNCLEITQSSTIYSGTVPNDVAVDPLTTYTFSYYVKTGSGTASINLGGVIFCKPNSSDISSPWIFTSNVNYASAQGWVRVSRTFTTYSDTKYVSLFICPIDNGVAGQKFLIDGVMLEKSSTLNTYFDGTFTGNLVSNSSFESGSSGWTSGISNVSASVKTSSSYSLFGASSLNISIGSASTSPTCYAFANTNVGSGFGTYTFSSYVYSPTSASIRIIFRDNNGALYSPGDVYSIPAATWTRVSRTVSQQYSSAQWSIGFEVGQVVLNSNLYIDGVMIESSSVTNSYIDSSMISWTGGVGLSKAQLGNSYIINNTSSALPSPALWISASSKFQSLGGALYINGASVSDNTYTASAGDLYHITLALSASNNSDLYLNGKRDIDAGNLANGTYGFIQFWNNSLQSANVLDRYYQFSGKKVYSIIDTKRTMFSANSVDSYLLVKNNNASDTLKS